MIVYEHVVSTVVICLGVIAALVVSALSYWYFVAKNIATVIMLVLRILFFALLTWCLFQPGERKAETQIQKQRFAVIIDNSKSMTMVPKQDMPTRWSVVTNAINQPWVKAISENCDIDYYSFSGEYSKKLTLEEAQQLVPDGTSTLLRDALKKTVGRYTGLNVAGCLLLTDGIDTREAFPDWANEKRPFPIYTLVTEKNAVWEEEPDVHVDTINTPLRVTVGWQAELKAIVSGQGTKGQGLNVQLFKDGVLQQELPTQIPAGGGAKEVLFNLDHSAIGMFNYRVYVPPMVKESNTNDNEASVVVQVLDAKNRLLYVEGPPRWESKYLTRQLKLSKQITPVVFLRGANDKFMTIGVSPNATPDMKENQLVFFKIIIIGNLDAEELGEPRALNVLKFVESGGSLILLGGTKAWGENGFWKGPLKKLLPAKQYANKTIEGEYAVALTDTGRAHPAFAGDSSLWDIVPPILSVFPDVVPTAGARALVAAKTPQGNTPVILTQQYGQGKVVAVFTDSLWKWQLSPDALKNKPYSRFWDQLISWLSPKEEKGSGKELEAFVDREMIFLGEDVEISGRPGSGVELPESAVVSVEITNPEKRKIPFSMSKQMLPTTGGKLLPSFTCKFKGERPGLYTAIAVSEVNGKKMESDPVSFNVKPFTPESIPRPANVEVIKAISLNSGGRCFEDVAELNETLSKLEVKKIEQEISEYRSLWQHWLIITCLMTLLSIEWIMRKMRNMP